MQIDGAQAELAANLAELRSNADADTGLIALGDAQLGALSALQRQLDTASPVALAMLRATVAASVAASSNLAQQTRTAASSAAQSAGGGATLASASADARNTVSAFERDMYERKIFDPYLHFASKAEEEAYRQREAERLAETKRAEEEHTPQGDLRAVNLSIAQLKDAGAHGADQSPAYAPRLQGLEQTRQNLSNAIDETKKPTVAATIQRSDPLNEASQSELQLPTALLASLKATGVTAADVASAGGHGLAGAKPVVVTGRSA